MTAFPVRTPARAAGLVPPLITGAAFYVAAVGMLLLTGNVDGLAALWPANGILLAALIIVPPRRAGYHVAAVAVASLLANLGAGVGIVASAGYTFANIVEALIAWQLAQGRDRRLPSFLTPVEVARFFLAAWVATLVSATLAVLFNLSDALATWSSWVTADLLGMLIVTPMIVTGYAALKKLGRSARPMEAVALLAGVGAIATAAFSDATYPLLFLPLAALLVTTLRLGPFGAAAGVAIVAAVGTACAGAGIGPLPAIDHGNAKLPVVFFQFYLLVLLAASLPLAALLAARNRLLRRLAESNRLLRLAEQNAGLGHWRIGTSDEDSYCSPEVLRIHGLSDDQQLPLSRALADYYPEDRKRILALVSRALRDGTPFEFEARISIGGEERRVHSRGAPDRAADGTLIGLFGTMQDVTRQVEGQHALEAARTAAEQAARIAIAAAETDALTGVANRRKVVATLDAAIVTARATGRPLSVAMIDLDHFKAINDRFGHQVGDEVLVRVARIAGASLRADDMVGRMGGEEFVLLLPAADADQAAAVAERVRLGIAACAPAGQPELAITASIGVATLTPGEGPDALLRRADDALYAAKASGRNTLRRAA